MLTPHEMAHFRETGQVTPTARLGDIVVGAIEEKVEPSFASRPDLDPDVAPRLIEGDWGWLDFGADPEFSRMITEC